MIETIEAPPISVPEAPTKQSPVAPTTKQIQVEVTATDIRFGYPRSKHHCPIALALERLFPEESIEVADEDWDLYIGQQRFSLPLPARRFVMMYDSGKLEFARPFAFTLEYPVASR